MQSSLGPSNGRGYFSPDFDTTSKTIDRVLIANRAEIAARVIRTCRELGKTSIAIYTKQDEHSQFWKDADINHYAGDIDQVGNIYLNIAQLIAIARKTNADAVHPGYGYLSENAEFARAVQEAGLTWIGPQSKTIEILGDKAACKNFLAKHANGKVPLIPGYHLGSGNVNLLEQKAGQIGFPVLLKASAGGGGKGMRIVSKESELQSAYSMAQSEAKRSFGSDDMLLEKYVAAGKHVEVQVFGDAHGNVLVLGDRECSVQRRHQKVIEEAPAIVSQQLKNVMSAAAKEIVKATSYQGAGTVEFIVDVLESRVYFLEVNTRIQVEHPITEEIFGVDLVALQLFIASGGSLKNLPNFESIGHAVELRLYAEDPSYNFLPQTGLITLFQQSRLLARYESSIQTGSQVSLNFDPMLCKIIVHAKDRAKAIYRAQQILASTICLGIQTNQAFMLSCLKHNRFADSSYTTSFIEQHLGDLVVAKDKIFGCIAVSALFRAQAQKTHQSSMFMTRSMEVITSPSMPDMILQKQVARTSTTAEYALDFWPLVYPTPDSIDSSKALNKSGHALVSAYYATKSSTVGRCTVQVALSELHIGPPLSGASGTYRVMSARLRYDTHSERIVATVHPDTDGATTVVHVDGYGTFIRTTALAAFSALSSSSSASSSSTARGGVDDGTRYVAPMPCKVIRIEVSSPSASSSPATLAGTRVVEGQGLLVVESMKTEVRILARRAGLCTVVVREGDVVQEGTLLATVQVEEEDRDERPSGAREKS